MNWRKYVYIYTLDARGDGFETVPNSSVAFLRSESFTFWKSRNRTDGHRQMTQYRKCYTLAKNQSPVCLSNKKRSEPGNQPTHLPPRNRVLHQHQVRKPPQSRKRIQI